jgi:hypothetical protein
MILPRTEPIKLSEAKSREVANSRVRLGAARRTIEELEAGPTNTNTNPGE